MKKKRSLLFFALSALMVFLVSLPFFVNAQNRCEDSRGACRASCLSSEVSVYGKDCDMNGNGAPNEGASIDGICCSNITSSDMTAPATNNAERIDIITTSVSPELTVVFSELIFLKSAKLYALNEQTQSMIYLGMVPPPIPVINSTSFDTIIIRPVINLPNGLYELELVVEDIAGNPAIAKKKFIVDVPGTDIMIIEPRLGVSNGTLGNLTVETSENGGNSECKITTSDYMYDFNSPGLVPFDHTDENRRRHTIYDFFSRTSFNQYAVFYVLCLDTDPGRVNRKRFEIYIDTQPPAITVFSFDPPSVVEYPANEPNLFAYLNVKTNEPTLCRYSFNKSVNYSQMTEFPGSNRDYFYAYNTSASVKYMLPPVSPAAYTFYAQCEDRAGWKSDVVGGILTVDLSAGLGLSVIEPKPATTNKTITLVATTIKRAICQIGNTTSSYQPMATDTTGKRHSSYLGQFGDGRYTYVLHCTSQAVGGFYIQEQTLSYTFAVDNSKPSDINSTGSTTTCFSTKFSFTPSLTLSATDAESGIDSYLFKIEAGTEMIRNWTKTKGTFTEITEDASGNALNLTQAASYKITAKAVNGAGLEGNPSAIIITYDPQNPNCFEKNPPLITIAQNKTEGRTDIEFVCTDASGCNNQSYYYGLSDTEECAPDQTIAWPFITSFYQTKYACYNISDIYGNSARGSEKITVMMADTCTDTIKDGNETDVDCGGGCGGCDLTKACSVNTDCRANFCQENICIETTCEDGITNGPYGNEESDLDCGGYCGSTCKPDQECNKDNDCESRFCNPDKKVCQIATCNDMYKNGGEEGADCGGNCSANCNDKNGNGIDDSWEQQYCNGTCDPSADPDGDGLTNLEEFKYKTNPLKKDTDGDGYSDGAEIRAGTDPLNPNDYPKNYAGPILSMLGLLMIIGGSGYLVYKRYYSGQRPSAAAGPAVQLSPEEAGRRRKEEEERQRVMIEQRRKELEERQRRLEELRKKIEERRGVEERKKRDERERLFKTFGGGKGEGAGIPPSSAESKPGISIARKPVAAAPQRMTATAEAQAPQKEEWVPITKIRESFSKLMGGPQQKAPEAPENTKTKPGEESEMEELEELAEQRKPGRAAKEETPEREGTEDVFGEIEEVSRGAGEKEEDIYSGLEDVGREDASRKKKKKS